MRYFLKVWAWTLAGAAVLWVVTASFVTVVSLPLPVPVIDALIMVLIATFLAVVLSVLRHFDL